MTHGHIANTRSHSMMNMPSVFSTDTKITIFFTGWTTTSITQYIFTLVFLFVLAVFNRFLDALRFQLERKWSHRESHSTLHLETPRKRCYPKAKQSPLPIYTHLSDHSEESLPRPHRQDGGRSDKSDENEYSPRFSYKNLLPAWESSGAWSLRKDGTRGLLEFGRAVIGYCL